MALIPAVVVSGLVHIVRLTVIDGPVEVDEGPDVQVAQRDEENQEAPISIQRGVDTEQHREDQNDLHALREHEEPPGAHSHTAEVDQVPYKGEKVED